MITKRHIKHVGPKVAATALLLMAAQVTGNVVVFGPDSCGGPATCQDFSPISQSFGDSAQVNLSYRGVASAGDNATVANRPWRFSDGGLSGGNGAFVGPSSSFPNLFAEVRFDLLQAGTVTLNSVDFGTYSGDAESLDYFVWDGNWNPLTSGSVLLNANALQQVVLNLTSGSGLILQFGTASLSGGIQNIDFDSAGPVAPGVPEPASWAMLLAGFGLVGTVRRRQRALAA